MSKGPNTPSQPGGGGPLTPSSTAGMDMPPKYSGGGPNTPNTPNSDMNFPVPSPSQNPDKHRMTPSSQSDSKFPAPSPGGASGPRSPMVSSSRFPVPSPGQRFPGPPMGPGPGPGRPSSTGGMSPMHDAPLNPSAASTMGRGFDPISSMAQMSQQLTSTSSANAGPPGGPPDLCNMVRFVVKNFFWERHS